MSSQKRVLLLGAGLVGSEVARCLGQNMLVTVIDKNVEALDRLKRTRGVTLRCVDMLDEREVLVFAMDSDVIVGAMPGVIAMRVLKNIIPAGKPIVDISFFEEDPFELDELAKKHDVPLVVDFGVAPGMFGLLLAHVMTEMKVLEFECLVGGLPFGRTGPWQYVAPFEPEGAIAEWTRPARYKMDGKLITGPAMSVRRFEHFEGIGTLEALVTDGLRTLLKLDIPTMMEMTLRWPGHREMLETLRDSGFFSTDPVNISGVDVVPLQLTSRLLKKEWQLKPTDDEFTVMRLVMKGKDKTVRYNMFDRRDQSTGATSMARTTGYACAAAAHLLVDGKIPVTGVLPPEYLGEYPKMVRFVLDFLEERNIHYRREEKHK